MALPDGSFKIATVDREKEFACHSKIESDLKIPIYFADPYSSLQRGSVAVNLIIYHYRKENVYIEGSSFVPQGWESVSESIKELVKIYNKDIDILDALKFKLSFVKVHPSIHSLMEMEELQGFY